jgi:hypothetical protein
MEKVDYASILADINAKIAALENAKTSLAAAWLSGALGSQGDIPESGPGYSSGASYELPRGALLNKSIPSAIKLYMGATKQKQSIKQISQALKDGGVESTADNFESVVTGSLNRLRAAGEVLRFKDGWGLSDHYPGHLRKALSQDQKTIPKKATRKKSRKKVKPAAKPKVDQPVIAKGNKEVKGKEEDLERKVLGIVNSNKTKSFSPIEIAGALGMEKVGTLSFTLGKMAVKGKIKKCGSGGGYQAPSELKPGVLSAV